MKMNDAMRKIPPSQPRPDLYESIEQLAKLIDSGFINTEGCIFLEELYARRGDLSLDSFPDEVGYECYVNHFHFDCQDANDCLLIALDLIRRLGNEWENFGQNSEIKAIVSIDGSEGSFRFHLTRPGQDWISEDLESYENDAVLIEVIQPFC